LPRRHDRKRAAIATAAVAGAGAIVCWSVYARQAPPASQRNTVVVNEGSNLAATISYPAGKGPFPGVVLVHGSGRTTRDQLSRQRDHLVSQGLVVLAYDKRGVGESTGDYVNVGVRTSRERMPLLGRDALACLRALRAAERLDPTRLGFLGASQAGWIIPAAIAAADTGEVRFAVILSGPATSVGLEHAYSEATGDGIRPAEALSDADIDARVDAYRGPQGFDHVPILRRMKPVTLWLIGERDESIPVRHTLRHLRAAIAEGAPITLRTYPDANHALSGPSGPVPYWTDVIAWLRSQRILR
jgi:dienelactone hydrolase